MTKLRAPQTRRVYELVYYCEKHGLLNKIADAKAKMTKTTEAAKHPQWLRTD